MRGKVREEEKIGGGMRRVRGRNEGEQRNEGSGGLTRRESGGRRGGEGGKREGVRWRARMDGVGKGRLRGEG